jgi:hypothetical protein
LLRVHAGWQILVLIDSLRHALKHVWSNVAHLIHVGFLLHALFLSRDWIKGSLLLRERWQVLLWGLSKAACDRNVLTSATFRTEHAVIWNQLTTGTTVQDITRDTNDGRPSLKACVKTPSIFYNRFLENAGPIN